MGGRGPRPWPLGAAVKGPPLHGRRRGRDRPDVGDVLRQLTGRVAEALVRSARALRRGGPGRLAAPAPQPRRPAAGRPSGAARTRGDPALGRRDRAGDRLGRRRHAAGRVLIAHRSDRPAQALELGAGVAGRRQGRPRGARGDGQRRRAHDHHPWLPRASALARRARRRGADRAHDGARVGPPPRREGGLQQPRLGRVRRSAGRPARPGGETGEHPRRDGWDQAVQARGCRRRAELALGLRPAALAGAREPPRDALAAPEHAHGHHQRARTPAAGSDPWAADARVISVRAGRRLHPDRGGDLLLRRRPVLRGHRRL